LKRRGKASDEREDGRMRGYGRATKPAGLPIAPTRETQLQSPKRTEQHNGKAPRKRIAPGRRQDDILKAALEVFSVQGFAGARLEEIARKAGVAKGTVYLYFPDKESLFEHMLQDIARPALRRLAELAGDEAERPAAALREAFAILELELFDTPLEQAIRLIVAEAPRFPGLAKFYHDEIFCTALTSLRDIAGRCSSGCRANTVAQFPHLVFAPFLLAILWRGSFRAHEQLDLAELLKAHRLLLLPLEEDA
jgi:AcrR family transcriptional regulator